MTKLLSLFILTITAIQLYGQSDQKVIGISDAVSIGLKNNRQIKKAEAMLTGAKGRFWSGISLPPAELESSYEYVPLNSSLSRYSEHTLSVKQSFEFPSNYFLKGSRLSKEEEIALLVLEQTKRLVSSDIKTAYYKVLAMDRQLSIAKENNLLLKDFSEKAQIRYNVGEGTNIERLTAKVQYTESINNVESAKNNLMLVISELNNILGFEGNGSHDYSLTDSLTFNELRLPSLDELYKISLNNSQQIRIAELNLSTSAIDYKLAWSTLLPNLNVSYFLQSRDGINSYYGASFGISLPVWFLFENRGRIEEASADNSFALSDLHLVKNDVYLKLKNSYGRYEYGLKQADLYSKEIMPQAEEIYRSASISYNAGEISYLELLQARQTFISARSNYTNILFDYQVSLYELENLTGKDLTEFSNGVK